MRKKLVAAVLTAALMLALTGCQGPDASGPVPVTEAETVPVSTVPQDGNPSDVTCKGTYTAESGGEQVVASVSDVQLTNEQLWVWYWAAVEQYRQEQHEIQPDFTQPLDTQQCEIDENINSWQQYFLSQALNAWHSAQAMQLQAQTAPILTEEAYQPNAKTHANCMTDMPATKFLYGYDKTYGTNTMHQTYLDGIPELLDRLAGERGFSDREALARAVCGSRVKALEEFTWLYNYAYSYLTYLSYDLEVTDADAESRYTREEAAYKALGITRDSGRYVDIRHILLTPEDADWDACEQKARELLTYWQKKNKQTEAAFSELAFRNSQDGATAASGGEYFRLRRGQLIQPLDDWCFDSSRQTGDTVILRSDLGVHILYFSGSEPIWQVHAREDSLADLEEALISAAKERFPMEINYGAVALAPGEGGLSYSDVLYPDIAHERYPEVPLYLQQDYPLTWFGDYKITTNGCGITTFSMLATYMSDEEWTPPEMCERYAIYSHRHGTDGMIFINEPSNFNFFFRERVFNPSEAQQAVEDGHIVVSLQHEGYWTRGGHYILFEKATEDGMVQVRDSNIVNYSRIPQHREDKHSWFNATNYSSGYWIFENKITRTKGCSRCGAPEVLTDSVLQESYLCEKCTEALTRRNAWLNSRNG